jgi:threonine/homoserine efflux transporter RhtA
LTFAQPFLIARVIEYVASSSSERQSSGLGLIGAAVLIYGGLALSTAVYKHQAFRMITMLRGGLVALIYSKLLRRDATATKDASATALISTDIQGIVTGCTNIHEF